MRRSHLGLHVEKASLPSKPPQWTGNGALTSFGCHVSVWLVFSSRVLVLFLLVTVRRSGSDTDDSPTSITLDDDSTLSPSLTEDDLTSSVSLTSSQVVSWASFGCPASEISNFRQSPIDISDYYERRDCADLSFYGYYQNKKGLTVRNSGQTARVESDNKSFVVGGPLDNIYKFSQMHFHWGSDIDDGSEHSIEGKRFPLEIHLVHFNSKYQTIYEAMRYSDGLAVVAVLAEVVEDSSEDLSGIATSLPDIVKTTSERVITSTSLAFLRPILESNEYYTYNGSLTTKPFCENVKWIIFQRTASIWTDHINSFRSLLSSDDAPILSNVRPLQGRFDRPIMFCRNAEEENSSQEFAESTKEELEPPPEDLSSSLDSDSLETAQETEEEDSKDTVTEMPVFLGIFPTPFLEIPFQANLPFRKETESATIANNLQWQDSAEYGIPQLNDTYYRNLDF